MNESGVCTYISVTSITLFQFKFNGRKDILSRERTLLSFRKIDICSHIQEVH